MSLSMPILGLKPYVLVQFDADSDPSNETGLKATVNAGGGIASADEIRDALTLVLASLPEPTETPKESE
ncbi:hypothetical protein [Micromonospora sediminicola]|uniref:hypothetical protein n=1 Tax=Micromonospora sediminicola TaxID=946078 RepID=UPI0037B38E9D